MNKECENCGGSGMVESGPFCFKPSSVCCGGCTELEACEECEGRGEVEAEPEELSKSNELLAYIIRNEFDSKNADHIGCIYLALNNGLKDLFHEMIDDLVSENLGTVDGIIKKVRSYEKE